MVEQHRMDQLRRYSSRKELAMDRQNKNILKERIKQKIEQTDIDIAAFELLTKPISRITPLVGSRGWRQSTAKASMKLHCIKQSRRGIN
jgi:hypothetical protein